MTGGKNPQMRCKKGFCKPSLFLSVSGSSLSAFSGLALHLCVGTPSSAHPPLPHTLPGDVVHSHGFDSHVQATDCDIDSAATRLFSPVVHSDHHANTVRWKVLLPFPSACPPGGGSVSSALRGIEGRFELAPSRSSSRQLSRPGPAWACACKKALGATARTPHVGRHITGSRAKGTRLTSSLLTPTTYPGVNLTQGPPGKSYSELACVSPEEKSSLSRWF